MPRTKEAGKQICPVIITLIYIIKNRASKTKIVIKVAIKIRKDKRKIRILVNSGIEANYIKRRLALNIGIPLILKVTLLTLLEKKRIHLYKDYIFRVITENILGN